MSGREGPYSNNFVHVARAFRLFVDGREDDPEFGNVDSVSKVKNARIDVSQFVGAHEDLCGELFSALEQFDSLSAMFNDAQGNTGADYGGLERMQNQVWESLKPLLKNFDSAMQESGVDTSSWNS